MRRPIIILEGPDGSGKTTLAKAIGGHYLHATYRFKGKMVAYHVALMKKAIKASESRQVVIDRWRLSEIIYGSVFRDGPENPELTDWLFGLMRSQSCYHVVCLPSARRVYLDSFNVLRGERPEKYDSMERVYDAYSVAIENGTSHHDYVYDRHNHSGPILTGYAADYIFERAAYRTRTCPPLDICKLKR